MKTFYGFFMALLFVSSASAAVLLDEGFEGALFPPDGWMDSSNPSACQWLKWNDPYIGSGAARAGCFTNVYCIADLISPAIDLTSCEQADLSFFWKNLIELTYSHLLVSASTDGITWIPLVYLFTGNGDWNQAHKDLSNHIGDTIFLRWRYFRIPGYPPYPDSTFTIDEVIVNCEIADDDTADDDAADDDTADDDTGDDDVVDDDTFDDDITDDDTVDDDSANGDSADDGVADDEITDDDSATDNDAADDDNEGDDDSTGDDDNGGGGGGGCGC